MVWSTLDLELIRFWSGVQLPITGVKNKALKENSNITVQTTNSVKIKVPIKYDSTSQEDLSVDSTRLTDDVASEYLAEIYLNQGKTERAIVIYQRLSLKFPKKKSFFANLIKSLRNKEG